VARPSAALQQDLARRVVGQVLAAHHVGDALRRVVDHHRQLVGGLAVGAAQHEVADLVRHVLLLRPEPAVAPVDRHRLPSLVAAQPPGARRLAAQAARQVPG
jgi:cobalamin biosynthesis protein CbiG